MIGYFPFPYPDELLHSICARFQKRTGFSNIVIRRKLFGAEKGGSSIEFPGRLSYFADQLSWAEIYNEENVILKHSLLPYYFPFLRLNVQSRVKTYMTGGESHRIHFLIGNTSATLKKIDTLRYCPHCLESDQAKYDGGAYWHRVHQARGVLVCPLHHVLLHDYKKLPLIPYAFLDANNCSLKSSKEIVNVPKKSLISKVSEDAAWLLDEPKSNWDLAKIQACYVYLLYKKGLAFPNGRIKSMEVMESSFINFCREGGFSTGGKIESEIEDISVRELYRRSSSGQEPIHHILFIRFLGLSVPDFYQLVMDVSNKRIDFENNKNNASDKKSVEITIKQFWGDTKVSLRQIGQKIAMDHKSVIRSAIQMGLPYPRESDRNAKKSKKALQKQRDKNRVKWLKTNDTRSNLYKWLFIYDGKWLASHRSIRSKKGRPKGKGLQEQDIQLAAKIPNAAKAVIQEIGKPKRAIRYEILRNLNSLPFYNTHRNKLLQTLKALTKYEETAEHYALRKIAWNKNYLIENKKYYSKAVLFDRLKLTQFSDNSKIREAFEDLWEEVSKLKK